MLQIPEPGSRAPVWELFGSSNQGLEGLQTLREPLH